MTPNELLPHEYNHVLYLSHEYHFGPIIPVMLNFVLCVKVLVLIWPRKLWGGWRDTT